MSDEDRYKNKETGELIEVEAISKSYYCMDDKVYLFRKLTLYAQSGRLRKV